MKFIRRFVIMAATAAWALSGCEQPPTEGEGVSAALRSADFGGFERAYTPKPMHFPADHGPHPDFREEWWYLTGNLESEDKRRFGFQLTIFRRGLKHGLPKRESAWASQDAYMAHFAVADAAGHKFTSFQRLSRGAMGLAGASSSPFKVWLEDWQIQAAPGGDFPWLLQAEQGGVGLKLELVPLRTPVLHGDQGLSRKSNESGNASYYYSIPRLAAQGQLQLNGATFPVKGLAWLDREWSTSMLADYQAGWDWFALQLDDGSDVMFVHIRRRDGSDDPNTSGTLVQADGTTRALARDDVALEVLDTWNSPLGGRYPARWRLSLKADHKVLEIRPILVDQELRHDARYWEGAVDVVDAGSGKRIGRGYVELTGYAEGQAAGAKP